MKTGRGSGPAAAAPGVAARAGPLVWAVLLVLAAVGGGVESFSVPAQVLVFGVGGALFLIGLRPPAPRPAVAPGPAVPRPVALPAGAWWWLVPIGGALVVEAVTFGLGSSADYPTLSRLADPLLERYPVRAGAFLAWSGAFWVLARR